MACMRIGLFVIVLITGLNTFVYAKKISIYDVYLSVIPQFIDENNRYINEQHRNLPDIFNALSSEFGLMNLTVLESDIYQMTSEYNYDFFAALDLHRSSILTGHQIIDFNRLVNPDRAIVRDKKMEVLETSMGSLINHMKLAISKESKKPNSNLASLLNKYFYIFASFINTEMESIVVSTFSHKTRYDSSSGDTLSSQQHLEYCLSKHQKRMRTISSLILTTLSVTESSLCRLSEPDCQFVKRLLAIREFYTTNSISVWGTL